VDFFNAVFAVRFHALDTINVFFTRAVYGIVPIWKDVPEQQAKLLLWGQRPNLVRIKTLGTRLATPLKPEG
jgi:hypothetical protein